MKKWNKFAKKLLAIIATIAVVFTSGYNVNAATQTIQLGPAKQAGKYIGGITFSYKFTTDGQYLYCVNMHKNTAQNTTADLVTSGSVINGGIVYILKNGFPEKSITGDTDKDYYITQTAIWWYLDETTGSKNLGEYFKKTGSDPYNMRHYVKELVQAGIKHKNDSYGITDTKLKITTSNTEMKLSGDYYVSEYIVASEHQNIGSYSVSLSNAPAGTKINDKVTSSATIKAGDKFVVKVPKSAVTSSLEIKVNAVATGATQYSAAEYLPRNKNMQNVALLEKETKRVNSNLTLIIKKTVEQSKVSIIKIDSETQKPLSGAVLALKDGNGKELSRWTSTTDAHVIKGLANGDYSLEEISAPDGYEINKNVFKFTISDSNRNVTIKFENMKKTEETKVSIVKIDANTKQPIAGAVLALKDSTGKELTRWTSTTNAHVIKGLANGSYTVEEISAPEGYKLNTNVSKFTITDTNKNILINFENAPKKVVVNINKVDAATGQNIAGAVMVIKDSNGEIIYKFTSTNSTEIITDIENGTYTLEEVSAPEGYIKSDKVVTFTIDDAHLSHQITFENNKEVWVPDTASVSPMIMIILGIVITGFGLRYIKNGQKA